MADQPLTELSLPDSGPALDPLPAEDDTRLRSDLIDEIFGVPELAAPEPERTSLRTSLEEEPPAENLENVALNLEHALSEVFEEVEGSAAEQPASSPGAATQSTSSPTGGDDGAADGGEEGAEEDVGGDGAEEDVGGAEEDGGGDGAEENGGDGAEDGGGEVEDGGRDVEEGGESEVVSNGQVEPSDQPETETVKQDSPATPAAPAAAAGGDDDDDIVVLDEISAAPPSSGKRRLLGPLCRRKVALAPRVPVKLRGPASKRKDFAELGPPSSRMPRSESAASYSSDSDIEVERAWTPEQIKMMSEARRLRVGVSLRLNNVCLETSQTARQWAVTLQQRREARKKHWEEVRRGPRPPPRRTSKGRSRGRNVQRTPPNARQAAPVGQQNPPVDFAATKQLMSLINRGVIQMNSIGSPPPVNGSPRAVTPQRGRGKMPVMPAASGRGRAMVQIPAGSLKQQHLMSSGRGRQKPAPGAAELAAIPDLGEKQRFQLMKLLQGNNGTSISPAPNERRQPAKRSVQLRPAAPPVPPPPPPPPPEPEKPKLVPEYCYTTSGSPDDLFSVYLSAKQQPEKCFVNMQINNQCLKVRLPARPSAHGMVFAQVTRSSMEPICEIKVDSSVFTPPPVTADQPAVSGPGTKPHSKPVTTPTPQPLPPPPPQPKPEPVAKPSHPCTKCSQRFPTAAMLEYHFSVYHAPAVNKQSPTGVHECPLCPQWKGVLPKLREHLAVVHVPGFQSNYTCSVCGRAWGRRSPNAYGLWMRHVLSHAKPVPTAVPVLAGRRRQTRRAGPDGRPAPAPLVHPAGRAAPARSVQPVNAGQFTCPQCNMVFPDVSKFPEHWMKVHQGVSAGAGGGGAASTPATRTLRQPPVHHRQAPLQHRQAPVQHRQAPVQHRQAPVHHRQAPVQHRQAPAQHRQAPAQHRQAPAQHRQAPAQRLAPRQRPDVTRDTRSFATRFDSEPATSSASVAAAAPAGGDGTLRCTRCGELFPSEPAYAQHWINAHTRIKLSADEKAAASRAAPSSPAPAAAADSQEAVDAPPPPPEVVPTEAATSDDTHVKMEEDDAPAATSDDTVVEMEEASSVKMEDDAPAGAEAGAEPPPAANDDSTMEVSGEDNTAMDTAPDSGDGGGGSSGGGDGVAVKADPDCAEPPPATQNGVATGAGEPVPAPLDPAEEAANLVPSDVDFEMSEETLDKMLEQIVPMKKRK